MLFNSNLLKDRENVGDIVINILLHLDNLYYKIKQSEENTEAGVANFETRKLQKEFITLFDIAFANIDNINLYLSVKKEVFDKWR